MTRRPLIRLTIIFGLPNLLFAILALSASADGLIKLINAGLVATAVGVCIAYFPVVADIVTRQDRALDRADLLALGIFTSWSTLVLRTAWSLAWRYAGRPDSWENSHAFAYMVFMSLVAATFYLLAPGAVSGRIPAAYWIRVGALTALGILAILVAMWAADLLPA